MAPDQAHVRFHRSSSLFSVLRWVGQFVLGEETVKLLEYVAFDLALRQIPRAFAGTIILLRSRNGFGLARLIGNAY